MTTGHGTRQPARSLMSGSVLGAVLMVALLAGCSEPEATVVEVAPGQTVTVSEAPAPENGIVSGIVGDDALYPLGGVELAIIGLNLTATTDDGGRFAIVDVPPGIYLLEGRKKDHATTQTTVDVRGGEVSKAVLLLARVPSTDPYHTTWKADDWVGVFRANETGISLGLGGSTTLDFELEPSQAFTVVAESLWRGTMLGLDGDPRLFFELDSVGSNEIVVAGEGANPLVTHLDARILPPNFTLFRLDVFTDPTDAVVVDAATQTFVTVFYNAPAPTGWSIIAGSV